MESNVPVSGTKKRKNPRYRSGARAYIIDVLEDAEVKDISITGCCIICKNQVKIKLHDMYVIHILPEAATELGKFELLVESRWIRPRGEENEIGFWVISSPMRFSEYKHLCRKGR